MTGRGDTQAVLAGLPESMRHTVGAFTRHLQRERGRSEHTVRAYVGDIVSLLDHAVRMSCVDVGEIDLAVLRSWLARLRTTGAARTSLARRAAAARTFTAWAHREGLLPHDVGQRLASPKARRDLPGVLRQDQAAALVTAPDRQPAADDDRQRSAVRLRDTATLELLYATGIRVSELCGMNVEDVDHGRRVVRVLGKGSKERSVPYGVPAARAIGFGSTAVARFSRPNAVVPPYSSALAAAACNRPAYGSSCPPTATRLACTTYPRTDCDTVPPRICSKAAPISEPSRNCSDTPRSRPHRSIPTSR
jgi:integrase/recombinase XerC